MLSKHAMAGAILCLFLLGCSINPAPKDVTGLSTYIIAQQIRCEARNAAINTALDYLTKSKNQDPAVIAIGLEFRNHKRSINTLGPELFKGAAHDTLQLFWSTGVAYNFNLEGTETNNFDPSFNLLKPLSGAKFSLGLSSTFDRERKNTRTFTITDNFRDLVQKRPPPYCADGPNYIYPISGRIGVGDEVEAFFYLTIFANLGGPADKPKGPPTLVDALQFTTTVSEGITPKVVFSPLGAGFDLADATFGATIGRKDVHKVVVGLALESARADQLTATRNSIFGQLLTANGGPAEKAAAAAVEQFLLLNLFSPTLNVLQ